MAFNPILMSASGKSGSNGIGGGVGTEYEAIASGACAIVVAKATALNASRLLIVLTTDLPYPIPARAALPRAPISCAGNKPHDGLGTSRNRSSQALRIPPRARAARSGKTLSRGGFHERAKVQFLLPVLAHDIDLFQIFYRLPKVAIFQLDPDSSPR